jgi:tetratricopeptide (TPR) repeat protein
VVAGRGDDEVGVPAEALWCDATALEQTLAAGDAEAALALYRGPLLEGLYVAGAAPELQDWLDGERTRLRERAAAAARTLAERAEREGRPEHAIAATRRSLELAPEDEGALRHLLTLLERAGDRAAALRAYEEFARRLAQELELEPSAETRALADSIRARAGPAAAAPASPTATLAVLPFVVRGDERLSYLGEGMVDLLATKLDGVGAIRTVDARALLHHLGREGAAADGPSVARAFGASRYVTGSILVAGGRIQATASLHAADGATVASVTAGAPSEAQVFDLVDELARELLAAEGGATGTRLTRLAALTTGSLDALKAYLQGEGELRAGRYFDAMERFEAAVEADPSFALAHYRLAAAAAGCALVDAARDAADRGVPHEQRLSPHDRLVFAAQRAWLRGRVHEAESLYNTITGAYPDDVEAWFHLGDLLFHSNPLRGRSAAEAREPFERVVRLVPDHVGALVHLTRIAAIEDRRPEMMALIDRVLAAGPDGDQALAMRALRAAASGDRAAMAEVWRALQDARAITVGIAFADVALYAGDLRAAAALARSFLQVARAPELRALCHIQLAHLALAGGQTAAAWEELARAEALDETWGREMRAWFATLPFVPMTDGALRGERDALARWDPVGAPPSSFLLFAMHNELHPAIRAWLLGLLDVRQGQLGAAAEQLEALAELEAGSGLVRSLTVELDAAIVRARGRPAEALLVLERARPELWFQLTVASPFFSLASQRFLRATLLEEVGRTAEAAGWYRSIAERSPFELIYLEPARARLAGMGGDES